MTTHPPGIDIRRRAGWLPDDQDALEQWLEGHRSRAAENVSRPLHPVLAEFRDLLDDDPVLRMHAAEMIEQVPHTRRYQQRHLHSVEQLLAMINELLTMAPEFGEQSITLPLGAVLDWTMANRAGFAFYRDHRVNAALKKVLNAWCDFLSGPDSRYVLNDSETGWLSEAARRAIGLEQFVRDESAPYCGFGSWNDFFTRRFVEGARPVAAPEEDGVIANACESTPYGISRDVQRRDRFWLKSQPYSLHDMLAGDDAVGEFVGGTVYQAFLSATDYHRWHSPVSGTIVRAYTVDGTYYSEADSEGADAVEPMFSQSYLAHVAARAVIILDADNPEIGLVAFVAVGMSEVSSCVIGDGVVPGAHLAKGDELGYFQFGGSTHCLVFQRGVIGEFALGAIPQPHDPQAGPLPVRSQLARIDSARSPKGKSAEPGASREL